MLKALASAALQASKFQAFESCTPGFQRVTRCITTLPDDLLPIVRTQYCNLPLQSPILKLFNLKHTSATRLPPFPLNLILFTS